MKRPAFQFYPADWRNNAKLRRCSPAARGVWMDILCLLHDGDEYGVLRWPLKDVANAAGAPMTLVRELVSKGVLKGADSNAEAYVYRPKHAGKLGDPVILATADGGPIWYCSRFIRDEWVRQRRGESTRFDAAKQPPCRSPTRTLGERQGDGPTSTSSSSPTEIPPIPPEGGDDGGGLFDPDPAAPTKRASAIGLKAWLEAALAAGETPIPAGDPVFGYAADVGIPIEFLRLAWMEFRHRHMQPDGKRYRDWRAVFRKTVRGNWLHLWWVNPQGEYQLTTSGQQAKRANEERKAAATA